MVTSHQTEHTHSQIGSDLVWVKEVWPGASDRCSMFAGGFVKINKEVQCL